jgi:glycosyltransferase involved in cell wall biosynthesis
MKVVHIITNLGQGGAEASLYRLIAESRDRANYVVVSLMDVGYYGPRLRALGVPVHALGFPRGKLTPRGLLMLMRLLRIEQPAVVQTWMYHANLVGGLVARWAGRFPVVWGIHHSNLDPENNSRSTLLVARACAWLSHWIPAKIVACAQQSARVHIAMGYRADLFCVIPNGYDLSLFAPAPQSGAALRTMWGIAEQEILLGMVARWDPHKDHANLLAAIGELVRKGQNVRCVLVGTGMSSENRALVHLVRQQQLEPRLILAGPHDDVPAVMNALDIHVLSSRGEAFPNVVAESMACGTPCVVTDVGDAALVVGDTGWVVPPADASALATAIQSSMIALATHGKGVLGQRARQRICAEFGLERMVKSYLSIWEEAKFSGRKKMS